MCMPAPLSREISDLSGSYLNGNTNPRGKSQYAQHSQQHQQHYNNISSVCSTEDDVQGFWRQAHVLSVPSPREVVHHPPSGATSPSSALIVVERNGVIELVKKSDVEGSLNSNNGDVVILQKDDVLSEEDDDETLKQQNSSNRNHQNNHCNHKRDAVFRISDPSSLITNHQNSKTSNKTNNNTDMAVAEEEASSTRIPIIILLLDPGRKQYELMQLWVDPQTDLVRDVLHSLQRQLSDKWRQDYDGLFQLRGDQFLQLVHIFGIAKYDVRPRELWVAKPWSMAAKTAYVLYCRPTLCVLSFPSIV